MLAALWLRDISASFCDNKLSCLVLLLWTEQGQGEWGETKCSPLPALPLPSAGCPKKMSKAPDRSTHFHFSHADGLCRHTKPKMSLKCIPTESERPHKNLLIPILNFNHWDPEEFSAQPAEPHGNHPGPNDSVIVTSLPPVCFMPAWPHSSLQKKTSQCHLHFPECQGSSSMCCNPAFFAVQSSSGELWRRMSPPPRWHTACGCLCLPVPAGTDSPSLTEMEPEYQ